MTTKSERTGRFIGGFKRLAIDVYKTGKWTIALIVFSVLLGVYYQWAGAPVIKAQAQMAQTTATSTPDKFEAKIEALKLGIVKSIEGCETPGKKEDDGVLLLDTNNQMSIGKLQFQIATVQSYEKSLYGKSIDRKEAIEIALDLNQAEQLAEDIIFKTKGGEGNWYNCTVKLGLTSKVQMIKSLEN